MQQEYGESLRRMISESKALARLVDFGDLQVFSGGTTYTCLAFLDKTPKSNASYIRPTDLAAFAAPGAQEAFQTVDLDTLASGPWRLVAGYAARVLSKMAHFPNLETMAAQIFVGLQTSADAVFHLRKVRELPRGMVEVHSKALGKTIVLEKLYLKPLLSGTHVQKFVEPKDEMLLLFPYRVEGRKATLIPETTLKRTAPKTYRYLLRNKEALRSRERGKFKTGPWYRFGRTQNLGAQEQPKVCVPRLVSRIRAFFDAEGKYYLDNVDVGGVVLKDSTPKAHFAVTALLNSNLLTFQLRQISTPFRGGFFSCNRQYLGKLNIAMPSSGALNKLVQLSMRAAKGSLDSSLGAAINELVYDLYGLTPHERELVEAALGD